MPKLCSVRILHITHRTPTNVGLQSILFRVAALRLHYPTAKQKSSNVVSSALRVPRILNVTGSARFAISAPGGSRPRKDVDVPYLQQNARHWHDRQSHVLQRRNTPSCIKRNATVVYLCNAIGKMTVYNRWSRGEMPFTDRAPWPLPLRKYYCAIRFRKCIHCASSRSRLAFKTRVRMFCGGPPLSYDLRIRRSCSKTGFFEILQSYYV